MCKNKAAVILCAGLGSRMGLPENINKCAIALNGTSAVRHTVSILLELGYKEILIVVGHAEAHIRDAVADMPQSASLKFILNDKYNFHGCNYSTACGVLAVSKKTSKVLIIEGDSLHHPESIQKIADTKESAASLIRSGDFIDPYRSVIAIGNNNKISRYFYDREHVGTLPSLHENENIIGECMLLQSFSGSALEELRMLFQSYKNIADKSKEPMSESGSYSIDMIKASIIPIMSKHPKCWINLNTQDDLKKAKEGLSWLHE